MVGSDNAHAPTLQPLGSLTSTNGSVGKTSGASFLIPSALALRLPSTLTAVAASFKHTVGI